MIKVDFNKVIITDYVANEYKVKNFEKNEQQKKVLNGIILVKGDALRDFSIRANGNM